MPFCDADDRGRVRDVREVAEAQGDRSGLGRGCGVAGVGRLAAVVSDASVELRCRTRPAQRGAGKREGDATAEEVAGNGIRTEGPPIYDNVDQQR